MALKLQSTYQNTSLIHDNIQYWPPTTWPTFIQTLAPTTYLYRILLWLNIERIGILFSFCVSHHFAELCQPDLRSRKPFDDGVEFWDGLLLRLFSVCNIKTASSRSTVTLFLTKVLTHVSVENPLLRTALFCDITQRVVVIRYGRFGTTYRSHLLRSRTQLILDPWRARKSAVLIYFAAEAANHSSHFWFNCYHWCSSLLPAIL